MDKKLLLRICINCKHFEILDRGYAVPGLEDTLYVEETCHLLGWKKKEYPIMERVMKDSSGRVFLQDIPFHCPYWEAREDIED